MTTRELGKCAGCWLWGRARVLVALGIGQRSWDMSSMSGIGAGCGRVMLSWCPDAVSEGTPLRVTQQ